MSIKYHLTNIAIAVCSGIAAPFNSMTLKLLGVDKQAQEAGKKIAQDYIAEMQDENDDEGDDYGEVFFGEHTISMKLNPWPVCNRDKEQQIAILSKILEKAKPQNSYVMNNIQVGNFGATIQYTNPPHIRVTHHSELGTVAIVTDEYWIEKFKARLLELESQKGDVLECLMLQDLEEL